MKADAACGDASLLRRGLLSLAVPALSLAGIFAAASSLGPPPVESLEVPTPQPLAGRVLFTQSCTHCHGDDATGDGEDGDGPDLRELRISNARIATVIRQGIHGEMPSFAKKYSDSEIAALVAYLRTLR